MAGDDITWASYIRAELDRLPLKNETPEDRYQRIRSHTKQKIEQKVQGSQVLSDAKDKAIKECVELRKKSEPNWQPTLDEIENGLDYSIDFHVTNYWKAYLDYKLHDTKHGKGLDKLVERMEADARETIPEEIIVPLLHVAETLVDRFTKQVIKAQSRDPGR